jgi:hypothetical protein
LQSCVAVSLLVMKRKADYQVPPEYQEAFAALPFREMEIIYLAWKKSTAGAGLEWGRDTSQSIERAVCANDKLGCLTGSSSHFILWAMERNLPVFRHLLGEEAMALQGLTVSSCKGMRAFSNALLSDLAGNAFCAPVFIVMFLVGLLET